MPTPRITLTATLQDFEGIVDNYGALIITLCGYGMYIPRIVGTSLLAKVGPRKYVLPTGIISIPLWGNDDIYPAGTFYSIAVMDDKNNIPQCNNYIFTGDGIRDLSGEGPIIPPAPGVIPGGVVTEIPFTTPNPGNFTLPHGLGVVPRSVNIAMTDAGLVWQQPALRFDALNLYLVASATGLTGFAIAIT